ncbi:MAG TPA: VOC family protein [Pyrinomonadaceae bacterium]|nr:VOC family protein [Pyrinomonadaceae bacterium]
MQKITTFLMFNDQAEAAMNFYVSIFRDAKILSTMPGPGGAVMGGSFEISSQRFNCFNGGPRFKFEQGISLMVSADTQEEIDHLYDGLSEGGEQQPCSWLVDKFGVSWQIVPPILMKLLSDPDREKAGRVMQAMFKMTKIIIADLEAAAAG